MATIKSANATAAPREKVSATPGGGQGQHRECQKATQAISVAARERDAQGNQHQQDLCVAVLLADRSRQAWLGSRARRSEFRVDLGEPAEVVVEGPGQLLHDRQATHEGARREERPSHASEAVLSAYGLHHERVHQQAFDQELRNAGDCCSRVGGEHRAQQERRRVRADPRQGGGPDDPSTPDQEVVCDRNEEQPQCGRRGRVGQPVELHRHDRSIGVQQPDCQQRH